MPLLRRIATREQRKSDSPLPPSTQYPGVECEGEVDLDVDPVRWEARAGHSSCGASTYGIGKWFCFANLDRSLPRLDFSISTLHKTKMAATTKPASSPVQEPPSLPPTLAPETAIAMSGTASSRPSTPRRSLVPRGLITRLRHRSSTLKAGMLDPFWPSQPSPPLSLVSLLARIGPGICLLQHPAASQVLCVFYSVVLIILPPRLQL